MLPRSPKNSDLHGTACDSDSRQLRICVPVQERVHERPHNRSQLQLKMQVWSLAAHTLSPVFATEASACKKAGKAGSSIQRSVETGMAVEYPRGGSAMNRQASRESTDGSMNSYSSEGK